MNKQRSEDLAVVVFLSCFIFILAMISVLTLRSSSISETEIKSQCVVVEACYSNLKEIDPTHCHKLKDELCRPDI